MLASLPSGRPSLTVATADKPYCLGSPAGRWVSADPGGPCRLSGDCPWVRLHTCASFAAPSGAGSGRELKSSGSRRCHGLRPAAKWAGCLAAVSRGGPSGPCAGVALAGARLRGRCAQSCPRRCISACAARPCSLPPGPLGGPLDPRVARPASWATRAGRLASQFAPRGHRVPRRDTTQNS